MTQPVNPYVAGPSLHSTDGFFGRHDILESVSQELHNLGTNAIVLHGQRRIGKTTLLLLLENTLPPENFIPVYFDLQDQASRPLKLVLTDLVNAIAKKVEFDPDNPDMMPDDGLFFRESFIPYVYEKLPGRQRLVFLFDEFDVLDQSTQEELPEKAAGRELFPFLRNLMNKDTRSVYVFAIGRQAEELSFDFTATFKGAVDKEIWVLDRPSAEALIRQAEDNGTLSYSNAAIERILSLTNGHPFFTQLLCKSIWDRAYARKPTRAPKIEIADVNAAINDAISAGEHALIWLWGGLNPAQKIYAASLAEAAGEDAKLITEDQVVQVLANHARRIRTLEVEMAPKYLVKQRVLEEVNDREYRFAIELFLRWIQQKKTLREVKKELDRANPLADQLFEVGHQRYQNNAWEDAIRYFIDALRADSRHVQAKIHLGDAYLQLSRLDEAVIELEQAYELDPSEARLPLARALIERAESKEKDGDDNAALDDCERVFKILPQEHAALQVKNRILVRRGVAALEQNQIDPAWEYFSETGILRWQDAIEPIRHAIQGDLSLYRTRLFLGVKLLELERVDEARHELDTALLAIYERPGTEQEEEVAKYFRDILDKNPHQTFIRQRHGEILLRLGKIDQAVTELEQVYREKPDSVREPLSQSLMTQVQIARKNKDWNKVSTACKRLAQVASASRGELEAMAEIVAELQENLTVAQPMQCSQSQLNDLLLQATNEIKILGVVAFETDWQSLAQKLSPKITSSPDFEVSILCESDNVLFSRALITDIESAKNRLSFQQLQFIRNRVLVDFPEFLLKVGIPADRVKIEIMHLPIPISIIQADNRVFANLWLSEGNEEFFDEITPTHPWYSQIRNYIAFYFDSDWGRKYACNKGDEVLQLFDHKRIPRGIYPRNSFYDTDYDQLVVWGFVFDRQGRLLIHRRADNAKDNQGMWDKSVGGHTDLADFDSSKAIPREVIEELFSEEIKQKKTDFTVFAINDEDMIFMGEWRPERRNWHPFDEIKMFTREWAYFRLRDDQRLYSPRILPDDGKERRLRVIADVFLFVAGPQLTDEALKRLKNSTFKLIELANLKVAMDKSLYKGKTFDFEEEPLPKFSPDLVNVMTGKLRDVLDEYSQYIKKYLK